MSNDQFKSPSLNESAMKNASVVMHDDILRVFGPISSVLNSKTPNRHNEPLSHRLATDFNHNPLDFQTTCASSVTLGLI